MAREREQARASWQVEFCISFFVYSFNFGSPVIPYTQGMFLKTDLRHAGLASGLQECGSGGCSN